MKKLKHVLFCGLLWAANASAVTTTCPTTSEEFSWVFAPDGSAIIFTWRVETIDMTSLFVRVVGNRVEIFLGGGSFGGPPVQQTYDARGSILRPADGIYSIQIMPFVPIFGASQPLITCPDPFPVPLVVGGTGAVNVPVPAVSNWLLGLLASLLATGAAFGLWRRSRF
ncbi:MAG: hypothetical protein WAV67_07715 [Dokdonella sp.]